MTTARKPDNAMGIDKPRRLTMWTGKRNNVSRAGALLVAALALHAIGCGVVGQMDLSITAPNECGENARAMIVDIRSSTRLAGAVLESASEGVVWAEIRDQGAGQYQLVAELDNVPPGTNVYFTFSLIEEATLGGIELDGVQIFNVPPSELEGGGEGMACNPSAQSVETVTFSDPDVGLALTLHNGTNAPIPVLLEGTDPGPAVPPTDLHYDATALQMQDWLPLFDGVVDAQQTVVVDIPDIPLTSARSSAAESSVRLVRMRTTLATGQVQKGVWQLEAAGGPLTVEQRTWGGVKALYQKR
jgi:hypothetical protein